MMKTGFITAVVWCFVFASSVAGQENLSQQSRCSRTSDLPVWVAPLNAVHGIHEFGAGTRLTLPASVGSVVVELWGGGGGGGRGSLETQTHGGAGGGGGASGSYVRANLNVVPGVTYAVVVGVGGLGGIGPAGTSAASGQNGGDSSFCAGDRLLVVALGGAGGAAAKSNTHPGEGGAGRSLKASDTSLELQRVGAAGLPGALPLYEDPGPGGPGGMPISGGVGSYGGDGGRGEYRPDPLEKGRNGGAGRIIVSW